MAILPKSTVYIDGFNLYHGIMNKGWDRYRWLDVFPFSHRLIPPNYSLNKVRYFTSHITGDVLKHDRQQVYLNALKAKNGNAIEIQYGKYSNFATHCKFCDAKPVVCKNCGVDYVKPNEKQTDVNICTAMLMDCFESQTDYIVLVSGDSDYEAPLKEISRAFPNVKRIIAFPPMRRNPKLYALCDQWFIIPEVHFSSSQLPDPVVSQKSGQKYSKPQSW